MIVAKFGGTSVKDANAIRRLRAIVESRNEATFVVVSALSGVTDLLLSIVEYVKSDDINIAYQKLKVLIERHIQLCEELGLGSETLDFVKEVESKIYTLIFALSALGETTGKSSDLIVSNGELLSSRIIADFFNHSNSKTCFVDSRTIIRTNSNFGEADVDFDISKLAIKECISDKYDIYVAGGFIASDQFGSPTTLGRGGSDYSAAIIAEAVGAAVLEIWTDVSGIMTCDPRAVRNAKIIRVLSYNEASELAFFGAKVLHPKTIFPAIRANIPVYVKNSYEHDFVGTLICFNSANKEIIKSIAFRKNITVVNIRSNRMLGAYGFLSKVFSVFEKNKTSVDIITTSEVTISLTIDDDKFLPSILEELSEFSDVDTDSDNAIICAVGDGIYRSSGVALRFFNSLKDINILMISVGASKINFSIVVKDTDLLDAVSKLHDEFFSLSDSEVFYE